MRKLIFVLISSLLFSNIVIANDLKMQDLTVKDVKGQSRSLATESTSENALFSTRNLAWTTAVLLGATALTGRERKVNPIHLSLASLSLLSYGAFLNSYFSNEKYSGKDGQNTYKGATYSKWLHIPAMIILPIAGAVAQRQFDKGQKSATGIGSVHKPAALASVVGIALATFSLTFEF